MKAILLSVITVSLSTSIMAKELNPMEEFDVTPAVDLVVEANFNSDMKATYLKKLLDQQQKSYEERIAYLETELKKTKDRLIEKSMNQDKIEAAMIEKYSEEATFYKRELAYKTKSLLEYQRQIEKMKPEEDLKNIIKLNTELASELRKSEDQMAVMQLKQVEGMPASRPNTRLPANAKEGH